MIEQLLASKPADWPPYVVPLVILVGLVFCVWLQLTIGRWMKRR